MNLQLELFDNKTLFTPRSAGIVSWFDLSIHEKINFKSNNYHTYIDRPYSEGSIDDIDFIKNHCLTFYIVMGNTEMPNHFKKYK